MYGLSSLRVWLKMYNRFKNGTTVLQSIISMYYTTATGNDDIIIFADRKEASHLQNVAVAWSIGLDLNLPRRESTVHDYCCLWYKTKLPS